MATEDAEQRNIVLCSDGTGQRGGPGRQTNVWRTYLAVDPEPEDDLWQVRVHDDGVGSQDFAVVRIIGGAFGAGISRNIRQLYAALITSYKPGARIYLFGFSRGAYTVRILANLICMFGVPDGKDKTPRQILDIAQLALHAYKAANIELSTSGKSDIADKFRARHVNVLKARPEDGPYSVHFLGCWETVGAIGLPFDELTKLVMPLFPLRFQNNTPPKGVHHLCQALAIDEERHAFHPELWDESVPKNQNENDKESGFKQTLEQVWFPGVHANVGGGYPKDQLAIEPLKWMIGQAQKRGLKFNKDVLDRYYYEASPHGKMYDSRAGLAAYYRYRPRRIDRLHTGDCNPKIHASALNRIGYRAVAYAPTAITSRDYDIVETIKPVADGKGVKSTSELKSSFSELDDQKDRRVTLIEKAHDYAALNRIGYYLFIFWTVLFLVYGISQASKTVVKPLVAAPEYQYPDDRDAIVGIEKKKANAVEAVRFLVKGTYSLENAVLKTASAVLPEFATPIFRGYQNSPGMFLLMSSLLAVMLYISQAVVTQKRSVAADAWQSGSQISAGESAPPPLGLSWFGWFRRTLVWCLDLAVIPLIEGLRAIVVWYRSRSFVRTLSDRLRAPAALLLGLAIVVGLVFGLYKGFQYAWTSYHRTELGTPQMAQTIELQSRLLEPDEPVYLTFESNEPYFPTGVIVVQGQHYEVKITVDEANIDWRDATLEASPYGLTKSEKIMHKLFKRDRRNKVFTLMAAIGPDAIDPFELVKSKDDKNNDGTSKTDPTKFVEVKEFTAATSGPLYLFVNDVPGFYHNNKGKASVRITRVSASDKATE